MCVEVQETKCRPTNTISTLMTKKKRNKKKLIVKSQLQILRILQIPSASIDPCDLISTPLTNEPFCASACPTKLTVTTQTSTAAAKLQQVVLEVRFIFLRLLFLLSTTITVRLLMHSELVFPLLLFGEVLGPRHILFCRPVDRRRPALHSSLFLGALFFAL